MSRANQIPYSWEDIEAQIRRAILAQASIISAFGPDHSGAVEAFLGVSANSVGDFDGMTTAEEQAAKIDISRHNIYHLVQRAYLYVYQLDGFQHTSADDVYEIGCGLLNGYAHTDLHGEDSPFCPLNDFPLRRVLEAFLARWNWNKHGEGLTVRQLSLLANMAEPTVRSSLSKEGFRLQGQYSDKDDDRRAQLSAGDALQWLSRRRGFIPNRGGIEPELRSSVVSDILSSGETSFSAALARVLDVTEVAPQQLVGTVQVSEQWLQGLLAGRPVEIDIPSLKRIAEALGASKVEFVGKAVQHLLSVEND